MESKNVKNFILLGIFLVLLLGCTRRERAINTQAEADSLIKMVERKIEEKREIEEFRQKILPPNFEERIRNYLPIIRKYSKRYGFDWRLIVMQILKESRFKENARSRVGAVGLMQIMPGTAREIRKEMDIEYIASNPRDNIAAGIYHLYKQMHYFPNSDRENRIKLALASYNSGPGRIFDAQDIARFLKMDPNKWESVKYCLPKLTPKYWRLHLEVWELGVPNYGYFYGYEQTINYVEDIIRYYNIFRKMF